MKKHQRLSKTMRQRLAQFADIGSRSKNVGRAVTWQPKLGHCGVYVKKRQVLPASIGSRSGENWFLEGHRT